MYHQHKQQKVTLYRQCKQQNASFSTLTQTANCTMSTPTQTAICKLHHICHNYTPHYTNILLLPIHYYPHNTTHTLPISFFPLPTANCKHSFSYLQLQLDIPLKQPRLATHPHCPSQHPPRHIHPTLPNLKLRIHQPHLCKRKPLVWD